MKYFTITVNKIFPHVFYCKIFLSIVPNIWINSVNISRNKIDSDGIKEVYEKNNNHNTLKTNNEIIRLIDCANNHNFELTYTLLK